MTETKTRTLIRIALWRVIATLITAIWTGFGTAVAIHIVLLITHYAYERAWLKTDWLKQAE